MSLGTATRVGPRLQLARIDFVQAALVAAMLVSLGLWGFSLRDVDVEAMNDLGLASVLTPLTGAAYALLTATFAIAVVSRPQARWLLLLHVLALIVMLFTLPAVLESAARFSVSWRHAGIIEVLTRTGRIDPSIDAYFSWPGFFALGAFVTQAAGLASPIEMAPLAPLAFNLLYLPAVLLIMRAGTSDARLVWTGTWIFFVGNWIGQDYFSPQGLAYFLYLLVLAVLLTLFRHAPPEDGWLARWFRPWDADRARPELRPHQRAALMASVLLLFATTVYSHQLTPFAIVGIVILLVAVRRVDATGLPVVMLVLLSAWLSYMTVEYLSGHIASLIARIGSVDSTVTANLTDRFRGSSLHLLVLGVRALTTLMIFGLAFIGSLDRLVQGRRDLTWPALAAAPFGLLLLQSYGGEMLLRVYLFALPFAAFLAAHAFAAVGTRGRPRHALVLFGVLSILAGAFLVSRYGNERMDMVTSTEVAGMERLYTLAPRDSLLVALTDNTVWKFKDYELYHYAVVNREARSLDLSAIIARMRRDPERQAFLVISRSQLAALELQGGMSPLEVDELVGDVASDPRLSLVFENAEVSVFSTTDQVSS